LFKIASPISSVLNSVLSWCSIGQGFGRCPMLRRCAGRSCFSARLCSASPGWPLQKALKKAGPGSDMCLVWKRHKSRPRSSLLWQIGWKINLPPFVALKSQRSGHKPEDRDPTRCAMETPM
jgi:hypothetical protein